MYVILYICMLPSATGCGADVENDTMTEEKQEEAETVLDKCVYARIEFIPFTE